MKTSIFRSLAHRNYRLFFIGQMISVNGTWLQLTAMPWLVYRLTNSVLLLGLIGFLSQIPILLLSPFTGIIVDHYDRKKLIIFTQIFSMLQALTLAVLTLTGRVQVWHITVLALVIGIINSLDMPARQSFVIELVSRDDLMNAIGLNSMIFNSARMIGPAIAGVLIGAFGEGWCFFINGLSFIPVIVALFFIIPLRMSKGTDRTAVAQRFLAGINYIRTHPRITAVLMLLSVTGLVGVFPMILMPVFVRDIYHLSASGLGIFMSAMGIGSLLGTLKIAANQSIEGIERTIYVSAIGLGTLMIVFALIKSIPSVLVLLAAIGFFLVLQMGLSNTLIQLTTPNELRGRVLGFFVMAFIGFAPIGSITAGFLAHHISAPAAVGIGGVVSVLAALILRKRIFVHA